MSEQLSRPPETESYTRRDIVKKATAYLGVAALGGSLLKPLYEPAREAYEKVRSIGNDYSNDPFWKEFAGAQKIEHTRLQELLTGSEDLQLPSYRVHEQRQENPDSLSEFAFFVDTEGPVYAEFEGLQGDTSLVILRASVDDKDESLIPLVRDPDDQSPVTVQLGSHEPGRHRLNISVEHGEVDPSELIPAFTRGKPGSLRSLIDAYQPVIFPYSNDHVANNFPVRTFTFVYESVDAFALVYWKECISEDKEYGRFGTSVHQLFDTKNRTTDFDWDQEVLIDKKTGLPKRINIAEPYHNRVTIPLDAAPHTPLKVASLNNNVKLLSRRPTQRSNRISIRSSLHVHDDRWEVLYSTTPAIARLSVLEHIRKGHLDPRKPADTHIIQSVGLDSTLY